MLGLSHRTEEPLSAGVISLASGDPHISTPPFVCDALVRALRSGGTHYASHVGDPELRAAIANSLNLSYGVHYRPDNILITHGASGALSSVIQATLTPGDQVLLPEPTYSLFADLVRMIGAVPVFVSNTPTHHLDLATIRSCAAAAKAVIICNPCNPTGVVFNRGELEELGRIASAYGHVVIVDEAYQHLVFDNAPFVSALAVDELRPNLVYVQTFSKSYAMCGWRIGFIGASTELVQAATAVQSRIFGPINTFVQRAALAAIADSGDWLGQMRRTFQERRDIVMNSLGSSRGLHILRPQATLYAFAQYRMSRSAVNVASLCMQNGVAVRPGTEYGPTGEGHIRIAFSGQLELLVEGIVRLRRVFDPDYA
ncbi:MAG: pyridoxal phosphate-dependent aminotransferase [Nitrosospira sp.]